MGWLVFYDISTLVGYSMPNPIFIWFGLVLWDINHYWLFKAKSCFYIYIKYMICKHIS